MRRAVDKERLRCPSRFAVLAMGVLWMTGCAATTRAADDILIADFEGKDYGDWKATGEAFGPGPARGTLPGQMHVSGFEGKGLVNSFHNGDGTTGTLNAEKTMQFVCEKKYLNLPVKNGARKRWMTLIVDGKTVREFDIELADRKVDFWVVLDLTPFKGKKATLRVGALRKGSKAFDLIHQADAIKDAENLYEETYRPQFHFSSQRGWNNDSNGLVYYKGVYHLFYQHNPYGWKWGNMTWGHAVSIDLVHWTELGDAIHPDRLGTIFSGSAVVDERNTAGFQTGNEKVIVCIYTSAGGTNRLSGGQPFTQSIAYSNDRGRTWTVYKDNPVLGHINKANRDPKVIWYEPLSAWVMVLYLDDKRMGFFTSKDLKSWEFQSELTCFHECPELFELPVDGNAKATKWVLYGASGDYLIGEFDGKSFKPDGEATTFNHGTCFYASQTFNNVPAKDGRRIQIAWGQIGHPSMPFNQMMDFPVELALRTTDEGIRMFAEPVKEIALLHDKKHAWKDKPLKEGDNLLAGVTGDLFHIRAELAIGGAAELGFVVRGVPVVYNVEKRELSCKGKTAPLKPIDGKIRLELLVDRMSIEIFANAGRIYMPMGMIFPDEDKSVRVFSKGGEATVISLAAYELRSAWE